MLAALSREFAWIRGRGKSSFPLFPFPVYPDSSVPGTRAFRVTRSALRVPWRAVQSALAARRCRVESSRHRDSVPSTLTFTSRLGENSLLPLSLVFSFVTHNSLLRRCFFCDRRNREGISDVSARLGHEAALRSREFDNLKFTVTVFNA